MEEIRRSCRKTAKVREWTDNLRYVGFTLWTKECGMLGVAVGGAAVFATPAVLGFAGFTQASVVAGTLAAKLMFASAVANGDRVAAGTRLRLFSRLEQAVLESMGYGTTAVYAVGFTLGAGATYFCET